MKPFARINLSSVALRRGILDSSLALVVGRKQGYDRKKSTLRKLEKLSV